MAEVVLFHHHALGLTPGTLAFSHEPCGAGHTVQIPDLFEGRTFDTRPGARGAQFAYSCVPVSEFSSTWPTGVPVQVHGMDADPYFVGEEDIDAARALVEDTELFPYQGDQHYFADSTLPSYDTSAAALLLERVRGFLRTW